MQNFKAVYPFGGYVIEIVKCQAIGMQIELRWDKRRTLCCPDCGTKMNKRRELPQWAFDLSCGAGKVVYVIYPAIQGTCSSCGGYKTVRPAEIHPRRHATWRLMRYVSKLARFVPCDFMEEVCAVPAATAWRYDRDVLEADLPEPKLDGLEALLIDEKAVRKGHGYVTLVLNAATGELLHMHEGKKKESLESFFAKLNEEQKASIKAVCIDRSGAYRSVVEEQLPHADIVFDRFHLMANLNAAIDEVRRSEYSQATGELRNVIKGQRYNLLRNPENLREEGRIALDKVLEINESLSIAYVLKEHFRVVWSYEQAGWARRCLKQWIAWAKDSAIQPLIRFAKGVERDIEQIVSWCRHRITNARIDESASI